MLRSPVRFIVNGWQGSRKALFLSLGQKPEGFCMKEEQLQIVHHPAKRNTGRQPGSFEPAGFCISLSGFGTETGTKSVELNETIENIMESLKIGLCALSNPPRRESLSPFILKLEQLDIDVTLAEGLFENVSAMQRAASWNAMMETNTYDYIFDVSGGDLANLTLPYLNYEAYQNADTVFCGYSDLTCVLNALVQITGRPCILFQPVGHQPFEEVIQWLSGQDARSLFTWQCDPILEGKLDGKVTGGNLRCLLKCAGTPYFPDVQGKVLFVESYSGSMARIQAYFAQLSQMGILSEIQGIMLGQFTQLDDAYGFEMSTTLLRDIFLEASGNMQLPLWRTRQIGHSADSKAIWIGKNLVISC